MLAGKCEVLPSSSHEQLVRPDGPPHIGQLALTAEPDAYRRIEDEFGFHTPQGMTMPQVLARLSRNHEHVVRGLFGLFPFDTIQTQQEVAEQMGSTLKNLTGSTMTRIRQQLRGATIEEPDKVRKRRSDVPLEALALALEHKGRLLSEQERHIIAAVNGLPPDYLWPVPLGHLSSWLGRTVTPQSVARIERLAVKKLFWSSAPPARQPAPQLVLSEEPTDMAPSPASKEFALLRPEQEVELAIKIEAGQFAAYLLGEVAVGTLTTRDLAMRFPGVEPGTCVTDLERVVKDGAKAFEHFIGANQRLVWFFARPLGRHVPGLLQDCVQAGQAGLVRAALGFDYKRGLKFSTYAGRHIRGAVSDAIETELFTDKLPHYLRAKGLPLLRTQEEFVATHHREPTDAELADILELDEAAVSRIKAAFKPVLSTGARITAQDPDSDTYGDLNADKQQLAVDAQVVAASMRGHIRQKLEDILRQQKIKPRDIAIAMAVLADGETHAVQVSRYGLTKQRISQIIERAQSAIRTSSEAETLRADLRDVAHDQ